MCVYIYIYIYIYICVREAAGGQRPVRAAADLPHGADRGQARAGRPFIDML